MARKSQHTFSKRQREQKKAEKAAQKRAKRAESKEAPPLLPGDENPEDQALIGNDEVPDSATGPVSEPDPGQDSPSEPEHGLV